jgi:hypothetical protein
MPSFLLHCKQLLLNTTLQSVLCVLASLDHRFVHCLLPCPDEAHTRRTTTSVLALSLLCGESELHPARSPILIWTTRVTLLRMSGITTTKAEATSVRFLRVRSGTMDIGQPSRSTSVGSSSLRATVLIKTKERQLRNNSVRHRTTGTLLREIGTIIRTVAGRFGRATGIIRGHRAVWVLRQGQDRRRPRCRRRLPRRAWCAGATKPSTGAPSASQGTAASIAAGGTRKRRRTATEGGVVRTAQRVRKEQR